MQVRNLPPASLHAPVAKRTKASVLHTDIPGFKSLREYQQCVLSSAGERRPDMAKAAGSIPAGRTINGRESEWRGPRPITGWQKVRILPLPPTTRIKQNERHRQTLRMCDRSGERARLLIWWRASAQRGFESRHILQSWTSYRSGRTGRTLNPMAQAHRRFESCLVLHVRVAKTVDASS